LNELKKEERFLLSKSKFLTYNECPYKFKLKYIYKYIEPRTKFSFLADKGNKIHKEIEHFYTNGVKIEEKEIKKIIRDEKTGEQKIEIIKKPQITINKERYKGKKNMNNFIKLKESILSKSHNKKHFFPISQEVDYYNHQLKIHGIIDAVYYHYEDDGVIIVDWKTGKVKNKDKCREEMAFYALCWNGDPRSKKYGKVKYWAMYFTQHDHLFFEKVDERYLKKIIKEIDIVQKLINIDCFPLANKQGWVWPCKWCGFKGTKCEGADKKRVK